MSTKKKLAIAIPIAVFVIIPSIVLVAAATSRAPNEAVWNPKILAGPLVTCTGTGGPGNLPVCQNLCDLISTFANVAYFGIGVVIWIITPIMIAWGGIRLLISGGQPAGISAGKKIITGTVIGLIIVLAAYLIVFTFVHVLGVNGVGGFGNNLCSVQGTGGANTTPPSTPPTNTSQCLSSGSICQKSSDCCSKQCFPAPPVDMMPSNYSVCN